MISQIESDKTKPSFPLLTAIANRLGLPVEHFLTELVEDQFTLLAHMRMAEYYLLLNEPEKAERSLLSVNPPMPPGLDYQEYHLFLARAYRLQERISEALHLLEDLREQALRQQDRKLLFAVCKESGYVEFATGNLPGAMHEWKNALSIGESLQAENAWLPTEARSEFTELYLCMHALYHRMGDEANANHFAHLAFEASMDFRRIRDIARNLVQDGMAALKQSDSSTAKATLERAIATLQAARLVEQSIYAATIAASDRGQTSAPTDPWQEAAAATTTVLPTNYLDAELLTIRCLLDNGEADAALQRIDHCFWFLEECTSDNRKLAAWEGGYRHRLNVEKAKALLNLGRAEEAMTLFRDTVTALKQEELVDELVYVLAEWLQSAVHIGRMDLALNISQQLKRQLSESAKKNRTQRLG
jgi:transcriptional regulator with XRE-family HTH domain